MDLLMKSGRETRAHEFLAFFENNPDRV